MLGKKRAKGFRRQFRHCDQGAPSRPVAAIVTASAIICNIDCVASWATDLPPLPSKQLAVCGPGRLPALFARVKWRDQPLALAKLSETMIKKFQDAGADQRRHS